MEVSEQSVEDRLAAAFEKSGYEGTPKEQPQRQDDPEPMDDDSEESDAQAQSDDEESESSEAVETEAKADDDTEEVEYEGEAYKLPKKLKDALLRQQDYTRKTQEVAEQRKTVEEKAQVLEIRQKFQAEHFGKAVEAQSLNSQLQQYSQVNWAELAETNPSQYLQLDRQYRQLQESANRVNAEIQQLGGQFTAKMQEEKARAQAKCIEELRKEYKDFGPDLLRNLDETGRSFGFTGEELAEIVDPRVIRVLHAASQFKKLQAGKVLAEKKVREVKSIKMTGSRSANTQHANAQLKEASDRLKKTGKASDAEAYLAARFARAMK